MKIIKESNQVKDEIFATSAFMGVLLYSRNPIERKICVFDLHEACKGPCYFNLAKFTGSLYISLPLQIQTMKQLATLSDAFLSGYFGKDFDDNLIKSIKLAELYMYLKAIWNLRLLYQES